MAVVVAARMAKTLPCLSSIAWFSWVEKGRRKSPVIVFLRLLEWRFRHRPHVHSNLPIRLNDRISNLREYDLAIRINKAVVSLMYVRPDDIDVEESLFDQLFHSLENTSINS
jgi:hypothetical protein